MRITTDLLPSSDASANPRHWEQRDARADTVVVIDVCRATTVATTAIGNGAKRILTVRDVPAARKLSKQLRSESKSRVLLCGERLCQRIEGFDLGNSPADYERLVVEGQSIVLCTSNGTRAIELASQPPRMLLASFQNLSITIEHLYRTTRNLHLVCAGTEGEVTGEDTLLAGLIIERLEKRLPLEIDDASAIARQWWRSHFGDVINPGPKMLTEVILRTRGGENVARRGFAEDLQKCSSIDSKPVLVARRNRQPAEFHAVSPLSEA
ncbi:MAG: 2-phosphosulfolactate phosphatase [Planctomycetota bacterium]